MDAVEYLKEAIRICNTTNDCKECPFRNLKATFPCHSWVDSVDAANPEKAVEIVEKWAAEHPKKTRKSEFLKTFPNANPEDIDPCNMDTSLATDGTCGYKRCDDCRKEYWSQEVDDEIEK